MLKVGAVDMVKYDFGLEALCMRQHALHQFRALYPLRIARPVVNFGCGGQLTALLNPGNDGGLEVGAGGVDCGGVTGGTGPTINRRWCLISLMYNCSVKNRRPIEMPGT